MFIDIIISAISKFIDKLNKYFSIKAIDLLKNKLNELNIKAKYINLWCFRNKKSYLLRIYFILAIKNKIHNIHNNSISLLIKISIN